MRLQIPGSEDIVNVGTRKQMFIDNHVIETSRWITVRRAETARWIQPIDKPRTDLDPIDGWEGGLVNIEEDIPGSLLRATAFVTRTMNQPTRFEGNPVMRRDQAWEGSSCPWPCRVMRDEEENIWKMWYNGLTVVEEPEPMQLYRVMYATSADGIHWERPALGVVPEPDGSTTNVVYNGKGQFVIKDPAADPARRYKMGHMGMTDGRQHPFLFHSPDGIHWTQDPGPYTYGRGDENLAIMLDPVSRKYVGLCRHIKPKTPGLHPRLERSIVRMQSNDLMNWSMVTPIVDQDEQDALGTEFEAMAGIYYEGMYLGFLRNVDSAHNTFDTWLTYSRDGFHWDRPRRCPFLPAGEPGSWDEKGVVLLEPLVRVGDELWTYYTGTSNEGAPGAGIAKSRPEGLVSIDAPPNDRHPKNNPPILLTKPLYSTGNRLVVNLGGAEGAIDAELLDLDGFVIDGYTRETCDRFSGDSLAHTFTWKGNPDIGSCLPVRIRFYMEKAKLYSLQIAKAE